MAVPSTLTIMSIQDDEHVVRGGKEGELLLAVFVSRAAAEHFVRYCVDEAKTFEGVRP